MKVEAFAPDTFNPLTLHWYDGEVPPFVGVAVNVMDWPLQIILSASLEEIVTLTGKAGLIVIVPVALALPHPPARGMV